MPHRNIIVTGGFGTLGRAVSGAFAAQGDRVARIDFANAAPEPNENGIDIGNVDLTDAAAAAAVTEKVSRTFGGIDTLVNIAGGFVWETLGDGDVPTWQKMFAINLVTTATMTKAALPTLLQSGKADHQRWRSRCGTSRCRHGRICGSEVGGAPFYRKPGGRAGRPGYHG